MQLKLGNRKFLQRGWRKCSAFLSTHRWIEGADSSVQFPSDTNDWILFAFLRFVEWTNMTCQTYIRNHCLLWLRQHLETATLLLTENLSINTFPRWNCKPERRLGTIIGHCSIWGEAGQLVRLISLMWSNKNKLWFRNFRFAVFALGSSAYPNVCAFGRNLDYTLDLLGGQRLISIPCGDELRGQGATFREWSRHVYQVYLRSLLLDWSEEFRNKLTNYMIGGLRSLFDTSCSVGTWRSGRINCF